ncbi:MAG: ABC transporter ATP-binding protein [Spirochaetaceae bacterium]|nr:ABC transporter ATP-binding protein [Spirochaetaceae bacterium]
MKIKKKEKKKQNSLIKNICIVYSAMFKRYRSAPWLVALYIAVSVAMPFLTTLTPSLAIAGITSGSIKTFLIYSTAAVTAFCVLSALKGFCNAKMMSKHAYTRIGVFMMNFFKKTILTDYLNIEPQPKQKLMGKAVNAVNSDYEGAQNLSRLGLEMIIILFGITIYGTAIFMLDWKILLVMLGMFIADILLRNHAIKFGDDHREDFTEVYRKINYLEKNSLSVSAGKDIRIYQMKDWFHQKFDSLIKASNCFRWKYQLNWYWPTVSDTFFNSLRDILAYSLLIRQVLIGQISIAEFTLYIGIVSGFCEWIYSVSENMAYLKESSHNFNAYNEFMAQKDFFEHTENVIPALDAGICTTQTFADCRVEPDNDNSVEPDNDKAPEIEFRNVGFTYEGGDKPVLKNLNFKIKAGEKIALVGNNGAGKTTIVKLLCGLYPPTEGEILVDGKTIGEIGIDKYQDKISVLFQDTTPIAFSIAENVCGCDLNHIDKARLKESLEKAGIAKKIESLPKKENSYITQTLDDEGIMLSGGETQKLLLAKAMYKNGPFLILDEPTSALDPLAESKIYEEYNSMAENKTSLFISHRLASTKFCDRIMFLDGGQIVEVGSHDELIKKGGKYREIFDIQSHYYQENANEN